MPSAPRTIGQVLDLIRAEFPDISVSKIRYLETEGLVAPDRDHPSGYRRFSQADIDRLLFVLRAQRDRYLPLKVIREQLAAMDRGEEIVDEPTPQAAEQQPTVQKSEPKRPARVGSGLMTRRQLLTQSELGEAALIELERARIIGVRPGTNLYGREALAVATAAKRLGNYGVDPRQLRVVQQAAVAEAALVEQALHPYQRRSGVPREIQAEVYKSVLQAHAAMLHSNVSR